MQTVLLILQECFKRLLETFANHRNEAQHVNGLFHQCFAERNNHEDLLNVHLYHSLAEQSGAEEGPEGNQEVATGDASQVKEWVGNLK